MRVKFNIEDDDLVTNVDSDYDGTEYISVVRERDKLIVIVNVIDSAETTVKHDGGIY